MRTLLVTSRVTFVPENYGRLVVPLARHPDVCALLLVQNRNPALLAKGSFLRLSGLAPRLGAALVKNWLVPFSSDPRRLAFVNENKPVFQLARVDGPEMLELCAKFELDAVLNARTRQIFPAALLEAPRWGCFNIHHGLLPEQRGLMNDLRALAESRPAGFSIHKMTVKIDAGGIVRREVVSDGTEKNYAAYVLKSSVREAEVAGEFLFELSALKGNVRLQPNTRTPETKFLKQPRLRRILQMRMAGLQL